MEESDIPSHFRCPISLQLMQDPVTIPTGITYDREHIERWIFTSRSPTCPLTKQPIIINGSHDILTPNHTLRRLIHSWCTLHRVPGPTPNDHHQYSSAVDHRQISNLLSDVTHSPELRYTSLQRINSLLASDPRAKKLLEASGAFMKVASIVKTDLDESPKTRREKEEGLCILAQLDAPKNEINFLLSRNNQDDPIIGFLRSGSPEARENAIRVLKSVYYVADPNQLANATSELFIEIANLIRDDRSSNVATKNALKLLIGLNPWGRNRVKAVRAGSVSVLVELLVDGLDRRACELGLMGLDQLCGCAEGRADLVGHGAGLAVVSKKILRVSHVATDRAVRILSPISRYSASGRVVGEMVEVGVVAKLCLVIQVDCRAKTKERAKEILRLHSRVWKNSPCIPPHLLSSYPSN